MLFKRTLLLAEDVTAKGPFPRRVPLFIRPGMLTRMHSKTHSAYTPHGSTYITYVLSP